VDKTLQEARERWKEAGGEKLLADKQNKLNEFLSK